MQETFTRSDLEELRDKFFRFSERRSAILAIATCRGAEDVESFAEGMRIGMEVCAEGVSELLGEKQEVPDDMLPSLLMASLVELLYRKKAN